MQLSEKLKQYLKSVRLLEAMKYGFKQLQSSKWTLEQYSDVINWLKENNEEYKKTKIPTKPIPTLFDNPMLQTIQDEFGITHIEGGEIMQEETTPVEPKEETPA